MVIITVHIRNTESGKSEGSGKRAKKQPTQTQTRPVSIELTAQPSLKDVKQEIIRQLQPSWNSIGVTLGENNIKLFCICEGKSKEVVEVSELFLEKVGQDTQKEENTKREFVAVEIFTTVPEDLFRTVMISQLEPAVFSHPDHAFSPLTKVSPLYCTAFRPNGEQDFPWFTSNTANGKFKVHGVSLQSLDTKETKITNTTMNPFRDPIGENEPTGVSSMTLDDYYGWNSIKTYDQNYGILKSSGTHYKKKNGVLRQQNKDRIEKINGGDKKKNMATKRASFFRFVLKKDLDLLRYGVALVYDNSSPNHVSLVRVCEGYEYRRWRDHENFSSHIFLTTKCWEKLVEDNFNESSLQELLKTETYRLENGKEPEEIGYTHGMLYLPKVAALFQAHDIKIEASAEPLPPPQGDKDAFHKIYEGALVLHHLHLGWDVELAIEALQNVEYLVQDLDQSFRDTLAEACSVGLMPDDLNDIRYALDWDDERICDAVEAICYALAEHSEVLSELAENKSGTPLRPKASGGSLTPLPDQQKQSNLSKIGSAASEGTANTSASTPPEKGQQKQSDVSKIDSTPSSKSGGTAPMSTPPQQGQSVLEEGLGELEEDFEELYT